MARRLAGVAWCGLLVAVVAGAAETGQGALAPPPAAPVSWTAWASERTPLEAAAAVLRLAVVSGAGYLLVVTVVGLVAGLLRRRGVVAAVARRSPPVVRWLLGAWLAGSLSAGAAADAAPTSPPPTMVLLPDDEPPRPSTTVPAPPAPPPAPAPDPAPPPPATATITLAPGDHLWSVAARTLATAWGRPPAEGEVAPYWRLLVALNRDALPNPADPDLVFPGDVLRLPPVPR